MEGLARIIKKSYTLIPFAANKNMNLENVRSFIFSLQATANLPLRLIVRLFNFVPEIIRIILPWRSRPMRRYVLSFFSLIPLLLFSCNEGPQFDSTMTKQEIMKVLTEQQRAWNTGSTRDFMRGYASKPITKNSDVRLI